MPHSPPSAPAPRLPQGPPAKCKFLAAAVAGGLMLATSGVAASRPQNLSADLDGDGKAEQVRWSEQGAEGELGGVKISVDDESVTATCSGDFPYEDVAVRAVRPWGNKGRQLLLVEFVGPNDFQEVRMVGRAGARMPLAKLDKVDAWGGLTFPGNGACVVTNWQGFWTKVDKHLVKADGSLQFVPQPFYHVGLKVKTTAAFPIYLERGKNAKVATIGVGSEITLVLCAPAADSREDDSSNDDFYLVKSVTGYLGWVRFGDVRERLELPWAG